MSHSRLFGFFSQFGQSWLDFVPKCHEFDIDMHHISANAMPLIAGGLVFWLCVVRALRWRRYNALHRKYARKWDGGSGEISVQEAQEITQLNALYDMPWLVHQGVAFALFKTYAIPSISKLLATTKELKSKETVSRRYADTEILITTWNVCPITGFTDPHFASANTGPNPKPAEDPRANIAIARTNWLHSKYNISNDDFLYTLCLFALEPIYWSDRWGWRSYSPLEKHALYVFWEDVGRRMHIHSIPSSIEAMMEWSQAYEEKYMVPAVSNHVVAGYTLDELLTAAPERFGIKDFGRRLAICLLDERTRNAMMFDEQPWLLRKTVNGLLLLTAFVQRFLLLPRSRPLYTVEPGPPRMSGNYPRMHPNRIAARPWYKPLATGALGYYADKLLVAVNWYTEMPSTSLKSDGYRLEEMGPIKWEQEGHEEVMEEAAKLMGCPVTGVWSLEGKPQSKCPKLMV